MNGYDLNFNVDDLARQEIDDLLFECGMDTALFCKVFFPEIFSMPYTSIHKEIFEVIDAVGRDGLPKYKKIVIKAPRGIGKTSIVGEGVSAKNMLYLKTHFMYYVGCSETHAVGETENIKRAMMQCTLINQLFGGIKSNTMETEFSKKMWSATIGKDTVRMLPRGSGQQVRGLRYGKYRPSRFVVDDFEDKEEVMNEVLRQRAWEWLNSDLFEAKSLYDPDYQFIYIDTLKHEDSCLQRLIEHPDWTPLEFSVCDENYESIIPEFVSTESIKAEVASHRIAGTLDLFYQEKMGLSISKEDASFKHEMFQYYDEFDPEFLKNLKAHKMESVVIVDPAKTAKMHNADSAIVCWGFDPFNNKMYVRDVDAGHFYPDELYDRTFAMAQRYDAKVIGVEVSGLDEFIKKPFVDFMSMRGLLYEFVWLRARSGKGEFSGKGGGKLGRIASLVPYYRKGLIYHNKRTCGALEGQLLMFPRSKKLDIMDAAAYIVEMLDMGLRYLMPHEDVELQSEREIEDEYTALDESDKDDIFDGWETV